MEPRDLIAAMIVIGGLILTAMGINGTVSAVLIAVVAFYFGADALEKRGR